MKPFKLKHTVLLLVLAFTITSCTSTKTAPFDLYSYQKTIAAKVETIKLMEKATTPYAVHKVEIDALLLDIEKLTEYEKNKLHNEITFSMWKMLNDKEKNL